MSDYDEFKKYLQQDFLEEAEDLINKIEASFSGLESNLEQADLIDEAFRFCHTLKGSAKTVGFDNLGSYAHEYENVLTSVRDGSLELSRELLAKLIEGNDIFFKFVDLLRENPEGQLEVSEFVKSLNETAYGKSEDKSNDQCDKTSKQIECNQENSDEGIHNENFDKTILLVDDDEDVRELMVDILEGIDLKVTTAVDGQDALVKIAKGFIPNLIFSDLNMPNMTGIELVGHIRKTLPEVPVIICSGFASREDVINFMNQGAYGFLDKPVDPTQLERMVIAGLRDKYLKEKLQLLVASTNRAFMKLIKITSSIVSSSDNVELKNNISDIEGSLKEVGKISREILNC